MQCVGLANDHHSNIYNIYNHEFIDMDHLHHMMYIIINPSLLFILSQKLSIINYVINDQCISDHVLSFDMVVFKMLGLVSVQGSLLEGSGPLLNANEHMLIEDVGKQLPLNSIR